MKYTAMAKKGERKITEEEITKIISEHLVVSARQIADNLGVHYRTAEQRLEDLVRTGLLCKTQHKAKKNTVRRYKLSVEVELRKNAAKPHNKT
jgi:predicted ArsR family transcriptional regulator